MEFPTNDGKGVINFFKRNILTLFCTPRAIICNSSSYFCNMLFGSLHRKYSMKHQVVTPYYPQSIGQVEVSNRQLKSILAKN